MNRAAILSKAYMSFNYSVISELLPKGVSFRRDANAYETFYIFLDKQPNTSTAYCIACYSNDPANPNGHIEVIDGFNHIVDDFISKLASMIEEKSARELLDHEKAAQKRRDDKQKDLKILTELFKK